MKCMVPGRQRQMHPLARPHIRRQLGDCAQLTLAEVFGYGDKRLREIRGDVQRMYDYYDARYPEQTDYIKALIDLFIPEGKEFDYPVRPGSGEKVMLGREHDIVYLCYAYQLRRRGFGQDRIVRFQEELCRRIRYYNRAFDGDMREVVPVMENRLAQRGIRLEGSV